MAGSTFQINPFDLHQLLDDCSRGAPRVPHALREIEGLESAAEVERAAEQWLERRRQRT